MTIHGGKWTGTASNLSVGGAFITGVPTLPRGTLVSLDLNLGDGEQPLAADARVMWSRPSAQGDGPAGVALRFSRIGHAGAARIARIVAARLLPPVAMRRKVRLRLPGLSVALRAVACEVTPESVMLESEIGWLQLGAAVSTELAPGDVRNGRVRWIGADVAPSGSARLRLAIDISGSQPSGAVGAPTALRRFPSRTLAVLSGVLLGCVVGSGLTWAPPRLGLRAPAFVLRLLGNKGTMIRQEATDPPRTYRGSWRVIPRVP